MCFMKTVVFRGSRAYVKPEALALSLLEDGALLMSSPAVTPGGGSGGSGGSGSGVSVNPFDDDDTDTDLVED